jgi:hypothetical protein
MRTLQALSYAEAAETSPVDDGEDCSRGFPLSAFCYPPPPPPVPFCVCQPAEMAYRL